MSYLIAGYAVTFVALVWYGVHQERTRRALQRELGGASTQESNNG